MQYRLLKIIFLFLILGSLLQCDEVYDYEVNNTTWEIKVSWSLFYQGEPELITFYKDGTTSWGGTWKKTDELTFIWVIDYEKEGYGSYTATYYAQFRKDLTELLGYCENTLGIIGTFSAFKR